MLHQLHPIPETPATAPGFFVSADPQGLALELQQEPPPVDTETALHALLAWSLPGLIGALGGLCSLGYLEKGRNPPKFSAGLFLSKVMAAFVVGKAVSEFLPPDSQARSGIILLLGFFAYPVLGILESRIRGLLERLLPGSNQ